MNTAATVSVSVVLEDWSVSSDQWLICTVVETSLTRKWANYGFHVGDRYFSVWFLTERRLLVTVLTAAASSFVPALQGMNRVMKCPRKQQTVEEDC
jgi:hypothetical protein